MLVNKRTFGVIWAVFNITMTLAIVFSFVISANSTSKKKESDITKIDAGTSNISAVPAFIAKEVVPESPVEEPTYPLTQEEIDLIALVTMGEAEGESELGKRLVIDTILNRKDDCHFPDTVTGVIYQKKQFSVVWNGRLDRCYIMPEIVELVKEELLERTNYDVIYFKTGSYSRYGKPVLHECCHYFSSCE